MEFERGIWSAALNGDVNEVERKLDKGFDVNQPDCSGYTALHYSSRNGFKHVCELLLKRGACVNSITKSGGVTALHRAAYCGHADVVELLLNYKANPLIKDTDGKIPLHKAAETDHVEVVNKLLKASSESISATDNKGNTALDYVKNFTNRHELVKLLCKPN